MKNIEYLSASSITMLYSHYEDWFKRYVLEEEIEDNVYFQSGTAIHNFLEEFFKASLNKNENILQFSTRVFNMLFKKYITDNTELKSFYNDIINEQVLYNWLFQYIQTWVKETGRIEKKYSTYKAYMWNKPKYSEFEFRDEEYKIYGYIDVIFTEDRFSDMSEVGRIVGVKDEDKTSRILISDYKTSSKQLNTFPSNYVIQLYIYALAMHEYGHRINWVSIDYIKYNSRYFFPINKDVIERTKKFIKCSWDIVNDIKNMSVTDAKEYRPKFKYSDFFM